MCDGSTSNNANLRRSKRKQDKQSITQIKRNFLADQYLNDYEFVGKQCRNEQKVEEDKSKSEPVMLTDHQCEAIEGVSGVKLTKLYYIKPCVTLAKDLLGKILARKLDSGEVLKGKIVETECYLGAVDKASHSYNGKVTGRNTAMFMKPGTAYVYSIYGMYFCFNISSLEEGSAVLIRSLEPISGLSTMRTLRSVRRGTNARPLKDRELCNGPSKLCQAMHITKDIFNKTDIPTSNSLWVEDGLQVQVSDIIVCKRIGIESAGEEWANKALRFYIRGCCYVSVKNKAAEMRNETT